MQVDSTSCAGPRDLPVPVLEVIAMQVPLRCSSSMGAGSCEDDRNATSSASSSGRTLMPTTMHPFLTLSRYTAQFMASENSFYRWLLREPEHAAARLLASPAAVVALRHAGRRSGATPHASTTCYPEDIQAAVIEALYELGRVHRLQQRLEQQQAAQEQRKRQQHAAQQAMAGAEVEEVAMTGLHDLYINGAAVAVSISRKWPKVTQYLLHPVPQLDQDFNLYTKSCA
jgi:hypothetical protein